MWRLLTLLSLLLFFLAACGRLLPASPSAHEDDGQERGSMVADATSISDAREDASASHDAGAEEPGIAHDDGLGHVYRSAAPLETYDEEQAWLACDAFVKATKSRYCLKRTSDACAGQALVAVPGDPTASWAYDGEAKGHVVMFSGASVCPTTADPVWR